MKMLSHIFTCLLAGAISYGAEVSIDVQPATITLDDFAVLSIKVRGAKAPPQPETPRVSQCLTAQATTIRNADETTFRFRIYPAKLGDITIGPIEYDVDGQVSRLITNLQVLANNKQPQTASIPLAATNLEADGQTSRLVTNMQPPANNASSIPHSAMSPADRDANNVASEFIRGNTPVASNLVERALDQYPDDEKLQKLKKLIEDQQNKDQKQQDKQDQQKQNDQKNQQQQDQQKQDRQKQDQQDQQKQDEQQKQDQSGSEDQKQQQNQQQNQPQPAQLKQAGEMSPEEAQQLLDAMKQDEQDQRTNLKPFLGGPVRVEKDW